MNNCIYLDIGNSNAKWKYKDKYFKTSINEFNLDDLPESSEIWMSNVSSNFLFNKKDNILLVESQKRYKSLVNSYKEPNMLGSDRWLAMIASYEISSSVGFIVVDIGSAVTIDLVNKSGLHLGGVIFPGLLKIRNTFDHFLVSEDVDINDISQSTIGAWSIGTMGILANGINQKIQNIKASEPGANIFLTGGGFEDVKKFLDFSYYYHKNLVLDGLELYVNNVG